LFISLDGSFGGGTTNPGAGGSCITVIANQVYIGSNALLDVSGGSSGRSDGGGSGGGILLVGTHSINISGQLTAIGGKGSTRASYTGGGGAGGRIKIFTPQLTASNTATYNVDGNGNGETGTFYSSQVVPADLITQSLPFAQLSASLNTSSLISNHKLSSSASTTTPFAKSHLIVAVVFVVLLVSFY
jgi:hypothetical protein